MAVSTTGGVGVPDREKRKGLDERGVGTFVSVSIGESFGLSFGDWRDGRVTLSSEGVGAFVVVVVAGVRNGFSFKYPSSI